MQYMYQSYIYTTYCSLHSIHSWFLLFKLVEKCLNICKLHLKVHIASLRPIATVQWLFSSTIYCYRIVIPYGENWSDENDSFLFFFKAGKFVLALFFPLGTLQTGRRSRRNAGGAYKRIQTLLRGLQQSVPSILKQRPEWKRGREMALGVVKCLELADRLD